MCKGRKSRKTFKSYNESVAYFDKDQNLAKMMQEFFDSEQFEKVVSDCHEEVKKKFEELLKEIPNDMESEVNEKLESMKDTCRLSLRMYFKCYLYSGVEEESGYNSKSDTLRWPKFLFNDSYKHALEVLPSFKEYVKDIAVKRYAFELETLVENYSNLNEIRKVVLDVGDDLRLASVIRYFFS
jgi:hypothetical protein